MSPTVSLFVPNLMKFPFTCLGTISSQHIAQMIVAFFAKLRVPIKLNFRIHYLRHFQTATLIVLRRKGDRLYREKHFVIVSE